MIPLLDLILFFNNELQKYPAPTGLDHGEVCSSTLAYLNLYQQTQEMINKLGEASNRILEQLR